MKTIILVKHMALPFCIELRYKLAIYTVEFGVALDFNTSTIY